MPSDTEAQIQALRLRRDQVQRARSRQEMELDAARASEETARAALLSEFGVETPEQASELLAQLDTEVSDQVAAVTALLGG